MQQPDPNIVSSADLVVFLIIPTLMLIAVILFLSIKFGAVWEPDEEE